MEKVNSTAVELCELVPMRDLQRQLAHIFPSEGSLAWELRQNRSDYVSGGAIYEVAGRLLAHPATFARIALEIGARKVAARSTKGTPNE